MVLVVAGLAYRLLRVDDIPETLEAPADPATLVIDGVGEQPPLRLAQLRGSTAFFVFVGIRSFDGEEGRALNRALNRWVYPEGAKGFIIFDAEGFGFLKSKSADYMERFAAEARFEMYGDFEGAFRNVFKLPRGHHGLVVLDADGGIAMRHSGGLQTEDELAKLRELLGATEPAPGPSVPEFSAAGLSDQTCATQPCALIFVDRAVALSEIPWVDGGFEGDEKARWKQVTTPRIRNISVALGLELHDKARGLIVGPLLGVELAPGWEQLDQALELREAFEVAADGSAMLILRDGRVAYRNDAIVPFYDVGRVSDLLGVELKSDD